MEKRKIVLGTYNTADHGWTLTGWKLSRAEQKTKYIEKPNGDGSWDLSTALTDGIIKYKDRSFTATLECSDGTRLEREKTIRQMVNQLDGEKVEIRLPDDETHYLVGRLQVTREYNDLAHCAVTVTAICEPWKYATAETIITATLTADAQTLTLRNEGRRAVVPTITVSGSVYLEYEGAQQSLAADGAYQWPALVLSTGDHALACRGIGTVTFTYREAVLE